MNFPADMLPMYTASMSSDRSLASWIAFNPASIPRSRKERSHSSPNSVSPTPITATSRMRSGLPHQDLTAVLRVRRVVDERMVRDHLLDRRCRVPADLRDFVRDGEVECVGSRAAAVAHREDAVARLRFVQDRAEAHHDRAAVRVPDVPHAQPGVDLRVLEAELLRHADREFPVRLVEHGVVVVFRSRAGPLEEKLSAVDDVLEVRGLPREAAPVARIPLALAAPEVRGIRRVGNRVADVRHGVVRADQEGGAARRGTVLEGIAGGALARVRSDRKAVLHHLREGEAHRRLDRGGPGLARELEVRGGPHGRGCGRLRDDRRRQFDGVRMGFGPDVDRADLRRIDVDLRHTRPGRFDGDRDHVLVGAGYALRPDVEPAAHRLAVGPPDHADVFRSNPVPRDVPAITDDACLHPIRSNLEMRSACSSSVRARRMLSISASFIASSSMFSGCTYTTMAGLRGFALIAIIGDRPYLTPVKSKARSLVDP